MTWARGDHPPRRVASGASCWLAAATLLAAAFGLLGLAGTAAAQVPEPAAPVTIDGPSSDILGLSGMSVARDGTGGVVYLKQVVGVPHVFVSRLVGGVFQPPEQVDVGLLGASSQPVVAAGNGGLLLVAFVNGGELYVVTRTSAQSPSTGPTPFAAAASNPSIALSSYGKGYLAFTAPGSGGHDVRVAYYDNGTWTVVPTALDADPQGDAGTGGGRPQVAVASDGVAIVAWGEQGHLYTRRVWAASPSAVYEQADVSSYAGWSEVSADQPQIATGGDSSYADVVFHEVLAKGLAQQSRVLVGHLRGSQFDSVAASDGVTTGGLEGAIDPTVVMGEFGRGLIAVAHDISNQLFISPVGNNGLGLGSTYRADTLTNTSDPEAALAMAGASSDLIAWQQNPVGGTPTEIRLRYSADGVTFGPELVVSSDGAARPDAARGLAAGGDYNGNAVVAWVQGTGASTQIVADQLYVPPSGFAAAAKFRYVRSSRPVLTWSQARDHWGPVRYAVAIDGAIVTQTIGTSTLPPGPLGEGPHTWLVTASNPAGLAVSASAARVWVDTTPPTVRFTLRGTRRVGKVLRLALSVSDIPPVPIPRTSASGIASILVKYGDGTSTHLRNTRHVYARARRYTLTIIARDRAGNRTTLVTTVKIAPKPKPKPRRRKHGHAPTKRHAGRLP
jgi:hypothetical protein